MDDAELQRVFADRDVVELTGAPGDVVIAHFHVFHTASPNATSAPRQMLGKAVLAATNGTPAASEGRMR